MIRIIGWVEVIFIKILSETSGKSIIKTKISENIHEIFRRNSEITSVRLSVSRGDGNIKRKRLLLSDQY